MSLAKVEKLFKKFRKAHYVFVKEAKEVEIFKKQLEKISKEMSSLPLVDIIVYPPEMRTWYVSAENDVFVPRSDVTIIRWHEPEGRAKYY